MILKDLLTVLFPNYCLHCNAILESDLPFLCIRCRSALSETNFCKYPNNEFKIYFSKEEIVKSATSLFYFRKDSPIQSLIHALKYSHQPKIGTWLGKWMAEKILQSDSYSPIDVIIPVPLHPRKQRKRGYNQADIFGKSLAKNLKVKYDNQSLIRIKESDSQTHKNKHERYISVKNSFKLKNNITFERKNVLIVDDVVTTGATLEACYEAVKEAKVASVNFTTIAFVSNL